jgi:predicted DsbA family dithiol-disulfide isomerase
MHIDVISDAICPWCYLGKRRLEKAMAQRPDLDFQVNWRPFQLNPEMPKEGVDRGEYVRAKFGGDRVEGFYATIAKEGEREGISFDFAGEARIPNTLDAHRLMRWAGSAGHQDAVVEALFSRYFLKGDDIGDSAVLIEIAKDAGMDAKIVTQLLESDRDADLVSDEESKARALGVTGVPCFIIERKVPVVGAVEPEVLLQAFATAGAA